MQRLLILVTLTLATTFFAAHADETDTKTLLSRIRAVGREGAGNAEAARASKALTAKGPAILPDVLGAMDDDNLTVSNWLRSLADTIAERSLADGKPLPVKELEKFLVDTAHSSVGRRLAYEYLVKVDPKTPARLLPGMLNDPSPELRRDAVAAVTAEAKGLLEKDKQEESKSLFLKAFRSACDEDQIDQLAEQLKKLGETVDRAAHLGVVTRWYLVSTFDNHNGVGVDKVYSPETGVDLKAKYTDRTGKEVGWKPATTTDPHGIVDLNKLIGKEKGAVAYAFAVIESEKERPVQVRLGSIAGVKVFLNGKQIFARDEYHHGMRLDQYTGRGTLKAGRNELLLKLCQNEQTENWAQEWKFQLRLCDFTGSAVPFTQPAAKE
jgi:hypothetical protein